MRFLRLLFLSVVALILVVLALANRALVSVQLVPEELAVLLPFQNRFELPLFVIIFGAIIAGLLIGFVWEYFREYHIRAEAAKKRREVNKLEREVKGLREKSGEGRDDVLALLD